MDLRLTPTTLPSATQMASALRAGSGAGQAAGGAGALNFPSPLRTVPTIFNQYDGVGNLGRVSFLYSATWTDNYSTFTAYPSSKGVTFTSSANAGAAFMTHYLACAEL